MKVDFLGGSREASLADSIAALAAGRGWDPGETAAALAFLDQPAAAAPAGRVRRGSAPSAAVNPPPVELPVSLSGYPEYQAALSRLQRALLGERIILFGDYDADGITSVAQVHHFLVARGCRRISWFVPDRARHGYGLSAAAVRECLETCRAEWAREDAAVLSGLAAASPVGRGGARRGKRVDDAPSALLVSLDCGTTSVEVIRDLARQGIDCIVVDHHQPSDPPSAPHPAVAHLNPHAWAGDETALASLRGLSAAGLAFFFCESLDRDLPPLPPRRDGTEATTGGVGWDREASLVLATLGTVADVVPLTGTNRALVRAGLHHANQPSFLGERLPGLASLHARAGGGTVDARTLGYRWGPRINASGRIEDARRPVELLLSRDPARVQLLVDACERNNDERKKRTEEMLGQALAAASAHAADRVLVLWDERWDPGIVGIVAGRLREKLGVPTVILGRHAATESAGAGPARAWKGSGRSAGGFDLGAAIRRSVEAGIAVNGGGHRQAAGVTLAGEERMVALRDRLNEECAEDARHVATSFEVLGRVDAGEMLRLVAGDPRDDAKGLVKAWCRLYDLLEPFGAGNQRPGLLLEKAVLANPPQAKTTWKGVSTNPVTGSATGAPRTWALSARFVLDGGGHLVADWTDPEAAIRVWTGDPAPAPGGRPRFDLVLEPHRSANTGRAGGEPWYDWRVVACERKDPA